MTNTTYSNHVYCCNLYPLVAFTCFCLQRMTFHQLFFNKLRWIKTDLFRDWILLVCISWRYDYYRGSTCKFPNARSVVLSCWCHSDSTSVLLYFTYIYTLSKLSRFGYEISIFKYTAVSRAVFRTAAGAARSYVTYVSSWKNGCQFFLMFIVAENTESVNILTDFKNAYYLQIVRWAKSCIEQRRI